jgi:hypothetical protein
VIEFEAPILLRYTPGPSTEMSTVAANVVVQLKVTCCGFAGTDDDASGFGTAHDGRSEVAWKLVICTAVDAVDAVVVVASVDAVVVSATEVEVLDELDVDEVDDVESLELVVVSEAEFELFERVANTMITAATIAARTTAVRMSSNLRRPSSPVGPYGPGGPPGPDGPSGATAGIRRVGSPPTDGVATV